MRARHQQAVLESENLAQKPPAYDPNNLDPLDEECRKHDPDDGIDYDEIIATTQDDWLAGNYKEFAGEDYPTEESLIRALEAYHAECWKADKR